MSLLNRVTPRQPRMADVLAVQGVGLEQPAELVGEELFGFADGPLAAGVYPPELVLGHRNPDVGLVEPGFIVVGHRGQPDRLARW